MKLSIIVPVLNEAPAMEGALAGLQRARAEGAELLVVDGGSADDTAKLAALLADRVLAAPRGRAVQMNVGAAAARGEALLFLHSDCRLPPDAAQAIDRALSGGAAWGRFDVTLEGRSAWLPIVASLMNARSRATSIATGDQGMFISRAAFDAVGGFPALPLMEDVAMSHALRTRVGRPACLAQRIVASGRRWDRNGGLRTIVTMWSLRYAYWRGVDPATLAQRYYGAAPLTATTLQLFAKAPVAGRVKTRLAATIGADAAADVYRALLDRARDAARAARGAGVVGDVELWVAPEDRPDAFTGWCEQHRVALRIQQGGDLGARMHHALRDALSRGRPALLIGSDVPGFDVPYLAAAASALQRRDAVVGPAEDGGYVLVGLARDIDLFSGIAWSTDRVMSATRDRLAASGASWQELDPLWDVDTHADLVRWQPVAHRSLDVGVR